MTLMLVLMPLLLLLLLLLCLLVVVLPLVVWVLAGGITNGPLAISNTAAWLSQQADGGILQRPEQGGQG